MGMNTNKILDGRYTLMSLVALALGCAACGTSSLQAAPAPHSASLVHPVEESTQQQRAFATRAGMVHVSREHAERMHAAAQADRSRIGRRPVATSARGL